MSKQAGRMSQGANDFLAPYTPTIGTGTDVGTGRAFNNGAISVTFTPAGPYAATSYTVTAVEDATKTATGASSPIVVQGLASGTSYTFKVTATNSYGTSAASSATSAVTATTVPQAPSAPTATSPSAGTDSVSWSAPNNGGKAITNYHWESNDSKSGDTSSTSVSVSQEQGTSQAYRLYATNANGNSDWSSYSSTVTTTFSFAPFGAFGFAPFGAFGAFGFSPFGAFGAFGFSPFGAFAFNTFSLNFNTEVVLATVPGQPDTTKPAGELQIGDKLKAVNLGANPGDWRTWSTTNELDLSNVVETTIVNIGVHTDNVFIYIDGDLFSRSHWILAKKDGVVRFVKSNEIDTTWQRYSPEEQAWVDITLVEAIDLEMTKISINCEPYDNFFTKKMLVFDGPEFA
jgi:hypothetical protein